ncbi:carbohydrate kinase family protein [Calidithermus chliarophilus]|uniref:carbohydrate kinase family protein n=1 Tax=Calidithermus chliarophilus TaxID=52023 RepID=UPI00048478A1|nr:carbohydrate kinase [Calidithermus chliarophilus]
MITLTGDILVDLIGHNPLEAPTRSYTGVLGGSALNTASVLARLGVPVRFVGEVGQDPLGEWALERLRARGVDTAFVRRLPAPTCISLAELDPTGDARYTFYRLFDPFPFEPDAGALEGASWFHFGSLSSFRPRNIAGIMRLLEDARARGIPVSFDPNIRAAPDAGYWAQLRAYLPYVRVFKCSLEDARILFPEARPAPEALLERVAGLGPEVAVLTLGEEGAVARFRGRTFRAAGERVEVVDTIGAGDTFTAGLVYGLSRPGATLEGLERALAGACALGALACTVRGAGLPEAGLEGWLERYA